MSAESEPQHHDAMSEHASPAGRAADALVPEPSTPSQPTPDIQDTTVRRAALRPDRGSGWRATAPRAGQASRPRAVWDAPAPTAPLDTTAQPRGDGAPRIAGLGLVVGDRGTAFVTISALAWLALVGLPMTLSLAFGQAGSGLPLVGVVVWLVLLRGARWLSPPARADRLLLSGRYALALATCDAALSVRGDGAWQGIRRLVWLNRRTSALLGMGRYDEALRASLTAVEMSADPETIATCALVLLRLNRFEDAVTAARLASGATIGARCAPMRRWPRAC